VSETNLQVEHGGFADALDSSANLIGGMGLITRFGAGIDIPGRFGDNLILRHFSLRKQSLLMRVTVQDSGSKGKHSGPPDIAQNYLNGLVSLLYRMAADPLVDRRIGGAVVLDRPEQAARVFREPESFPKSYGLLNLLGNSRFNTDGEDWASRRAMTQPSYNAASQERARTRISAHYMSELSKAAPDPGALRAALTTASLRIFLGALGFDGNPKPFVDVLDNLRVVARDLQYGSLRPLPQDEIAELEERSVAARADLRELLQRDDCLEIRGRLRFPDDPRGAVASDEFLLNLLAGVETTAATLCWAIDRIGVNEQAQERVRDEVRTGAGPYLDCFIKETMRYFPPIPYVSRSAGRDMDLDGVGLVKGQPILVSIVGLHHSPAHWREPDAFIASRAEFLDGTYDRSAFAPFLIGPRTCGGARLAQMELEEGLRALLTCFRFRRDTAEVAFDYGLAMRPGALAGVEVSRL